jgi:uncharacterized membrane protein YczE
VSPTSRQIVWLRRLSQLYVGLLCYGVAGGLMVRGRLGLDPWDVFHQGVAQRMGLEIGTVVIIVGAAVLLAWLPLRQRPGLGTISNIVLIGLAMNGTLAVLDDPHPMAARIVYMLGGVLLSGVATGLYIGANLGPGPRDGLMTGLARRTGRSIRLVRTGIEVSVLITGWILGGQVGAGTVLYALAIGPLAQVFIPLFDCYRTDGWRERWSELSRPRRPGPATWRGVRRPSRTPDVHPRTPAAVRPATRG